MKRLLFYVILLTASMSFAGTPTIMEPTDSSPLVDKNTLREQFVPWQIDKELTVMLNVKTGETFTIPLYENPTTGYLWTVESTQGNSPVVIMQRRDFLEAETEPGFCGAGGLRLFTFATTSNPGSAILVFKNNRPWEKNVEPIKILTVLLTVSSN